MNKTVYSLISLICLPHIAETIFSPGFKEIADSMNVDTHQAQWTLSAFLGGYTCGTIAWGSLADRIGNKTTMILSVLGFGLCCICSYWAYNINQLYLLRILQGLFGSVVSVVPQAFMVQNFSFKTRSIVTAKIGQAIAIGPAIGPSIGLWLISFGSWKYIFFFLALYSSLCLIALYFTLPHDPTIMSTPQNHNTKTVTQILHHTLPYSIIMGLSIGVGFYFFSQSRFFYLDHLGLSDHFYQITCIHIRM